MPDPLHTAAATLGIPLDERCRRLLSQYQNLLIDANKRLNLTAEDTPEGIQRRHLLESIALLAALREAGILKPGNPSRAIDIGTGAGVPGIPIAIIEPALSLTLVDATARKAAFVESAARALNLENVTVLSARAEDLARQPNHRQQYDLALAKALAPLPVLLEIAAPLLRVGGHLAAPKGSGAPDEIDASRHALDELGCVLVSASPLAIPAAGHAQTLVLVRQQAPAPERFPRRWAAINKRPL